MLNTISICGRLVSEPKKTETGIFFTVAVERNYINDAGQRPADFIPCALRRLDERILSKMTKGTLVTVYGRLASYKRLIGDINVTLHSINADKVDILFSFNETAGADISKDTEMVKQSADEEEIFELEDELDPEDDDE